MKELKKRFNMLTWGQIGLDTILFLLGLYFTMNPTLSIRVVEKCAGLILMVDGLYKILRYVTNMGKRGIYTYDIPFGLLGIVIGMLALVNPFSLSNGLVIFLGSWILVAGAFKLTLAIQLKRFQEETWSLNIAMAIMTLLLGILLVTNPFESYIMLVSLAGVMICVYAATDAMQQVLFRKRAKEVIKIFFE